jgi:hypothetical protein
MFWGLLIAACVFAMPAAAAQCMHYGATVTLHGIFDPAVLSQPSDPLDTELLPGRTSDLLVLDAPLCIAADAVSKGIRAATDVQLLCPELAGKSGVAASVTGRLVGAHTGNGHTPVLLVCNS